MSSALPSTDRHVRMSLLYSLVLPGGGGGFERRTAAYKKGSIKQLKLVMLQRLCTNCKELFDTSMFTESGL